MKLLKNISILKTLTCWAGVKDRDTGIVINCCWVPPGKKYIKLFYIMLEKWND